MPRSSRSGTARTRLSARLGSRMILEPDHPTRGLAHREQLGDRVGRLPHLRLRPLHERHGEHDLTCTGVTLGRPDGDNSDTNDEAQGEDDPAGAAQHGAEDRRARRPLRDVLAERRVPCAQRLAQPEDAKLLRRPRIGSKTEQLVSESALLDEVLIGALTQPAPTLAVR